MSRPGRTVGSRAVSAIALGTARWALVEDPDETLARQTVHAALDAGITLVDTAPAYTPPGVQAYAERLVGRVLRERGGSADGVLVSTKGGHYRDGATFPIDGRPETIRRQCRESLAALGVDRIGLYLLHWPDPAVPLAESVGALAELRDRGLVEHVGLCNVDLGQLRTARAETRVDAVQNPFSALSTAGQDVLDECAAAGIAHLAYSPLGGPAGATSLGTRLPAFASVAQELGVTEHGVTEQGVTEQGVTAQEVALAWLLAHSPVLVPLIGAGRPERVAAAVRAGRLVLDPGQRSRLDAAVCELVAG